MGRLSWGKGFGITEQFMCKTNIGGKGTRFVKLTYQLINSESHKAGIDARSAFCSQRQQI